MKSLSKPFQGGIIMSCLSLLVGTAVWMSYHRQECSNNIYLAIPDCGYTWTMQVLFILLSLITVVALFAQSIRLISLMALIFTLVEVVYSVIYLFSTVADDFFKYQNNHEQERLYVIPLLCLTISVSYALIPKFLLGAVNYEIYQTPNGNNGNKLSREDILTEY